MAEQHPKEKEPQDKIVLYHCAPVRLGAVGEMLPAKSHISRRIEANHGNWVHVVSLPRDKASRNQLAEEQWTTIDSGNSDIPFWFETKVPLEIEEVYEFTGNWLEERKKY